MGMEISSGLNPPGSVRRSAAKPPQNLDDIEEDLAKLENSRLSFGCDSSALRRDALREEWRKTLAEYLSNGFLPAADPEGPVLRQVESASKAAGVVLDAVNLVLREGVGVFGFYNNDQVTDCYYLYTVRQGAFAFFSVCIESGQASGGPYEISVSPAEDWAGFRDALPPA